VFVGGEFYARKLSTDYSDSINKESVIFVYFKASIILINYSLYLLLCERKKKQEQNRPRMHMALQPHTHPLPIPLYCAWNLYNLITTSFYVTLHVKHNKIGTLVRLRSFRCKMHSLE
jgi:hypothetical protein